MLFSKAVEGFLLDMRAGQYATATIELYDFTLHRLVEYLGDPPVESVKPEDLNQFMADLQSRRPVLSGPYLDNHWKSIRTFFRWCNNALGIIRPDDNLPRPKYQFAEIIPYNESEIKRMLQACEYSREFKRETTKSYRVRRPTSLRDKTILLVLLDTGMRVGELCRLEIRDVNLETGEVFIKPYGTGRKTRSRMVFLGKSARRSIWMYLAKRKDTEPEDKLFAIPPSAILWGAELNGGVCPK